MRDSLLAVITIGMGVKMATKRRAVRSRGAASGTLATLRRKAEAMMGRVRRAGMQQVRALERQMEKLNQQRQELMSELGLGGGRAGSGQGRTGRRGGQRGKVDWDQLFAKLPKTSFKASDVRAMVPHVAPGTLSQRLTGWVKEKKLKRTGSRRGTRYVRSA
jgi:hypothetical protein